MPIYAYKRGQLFLVHVKIAQKLNLSKVVYNTLCRSHTKVTLFKALRYSDFSY